MRQLSGLDASFLHMEDDRVTGHVGGLIVYCRVRGPSRRPFWRGRPPGGCSSHRPRFWSARLCFLDSWVTTGSRSG